MLSRLNRGERIVVVAGGILIVSLLFFPWHRTGSGLTVTALKEPYSLQGTLAFLVAVAMVGQIVMARWLNQRPNPALARLQPAGGLAVIGLLAWKVASLPELLAVGAYIDIACAGTLAYGGFILAKEFGTGR